MLLDERRKRIGIDCVELDVGKLLFNILEMVEHIEVIWVSMSVEINER
jgi:hypothetical protein